MNQEDRETERRWALKMIALEEELGPIVAGGAAGGAVARARRVAQGKAAPSAAMRARERVRFLAYAALALHERAT
jgi:hypothetical protein